MLDDDAVGRGVARPAGHYRLSPDVRPVSYRVALDPDLEQLTFAGSVGIDVVVDAPCRELVLNAAELSVTRAGVVTHGGTRLDAAVTAQPEHERIVVDAGEELSGPLTVELEFAGVLNDQLRGLYRSTFTDDAGAVHTIATTQLCVTDARRAFPCFDEPAFKATFEVTALVPPGMSAFSNAKVASDVELAGGRHEVRFRPTIKMSTYLVALTVAPFERTDPVDVNGVELSVVCTPGRSHLGRFALEVGAFALRFYEEYFAIAYPGDKIDLLGIPDFAYGAMENFGCITFREAALLIDDTEASTEELQRVALVVAHELAHMWFGDLVTMQWWEGLWLNEAFATHLSFACVDAFAPSWHSWLRFHAQRESGLEVDALASTRPIEFEVHSPEDASAMLDVITYEKGAAVLRMLEQYLGEESYRDGIRRYLAAHAYGSTVTADLWAALEEVTGEPVGTIMDSWIRQGGHPVLTVDRGTGSQRRFAFDPDAPSAPSSWMIPVRATAVGGGVPRTTVVSSEPTDLGVGPTCVANDGWGFYRSSYDPVAFAALTEGLHSLTEPQRSVLLSDTWANARAGRGDLRDVLGLARALGPVIEPAAWRTVESTLDLLGRIVGDDLRGLFERTARDLVAPLLELLGWEPEHGEDTRKRTLRSLAVRVLGTHGNDGAVRERAGALFDADPLSGDLATAVVGVVASMGRPGDRDEMLDRMRRAGTPQDAVRYRDGVAAYADASAGVDTLRRCFELFRLHEIPLLVARLEANPTAGKAVWTAMSEDWEAYAGRVPPAMQFALAAGVTAFVDDAAFAERVTAFHRAHPPAVGQQRVEQSLDALRCGASFARRVRPSLRSILT